VRNDAESQPPDGWIAELLSRETDVVAAARRPILSIIRYIRNHQYLLLQQQQQQQQP